MSTEQTEATITISLTQLTEAMAEWEADFRAGKTITHKEASRKDIATVAREGAENLWRMLTRA